MLSGAECSTSSNPLAQFMKHTEGDRSLQQDRVQGGSGGPSGAGLRHLPSGGMQMGNGGSGGAAEAEAFFRQQQGGGGQPGAANATPFDFEAMRREMENLRARGGGGGGGVGASGPGWAEEMARQAAGGRGPPPPELMRQMMAGGGGGGGGPSMAEMEAAFGRNGGPNGAEGAFRLFQD